MKYTVLWNQTAQEIFTGTIFPAPYNETLPQEFVTATFWEAGVLSLTCGEEITSVTLRPRSLGLTCSFDAHSVQIPVDRPMNFSVEINGDRNHNLLVFLRPQREDPVGGKILRFAKGYHEIGKLKITEDDTTIFLEEGAFLDGKIELNHCKNVRILGNGVLSERHYRELPRRSILDVIACKNVTIQDITLCDSLFWNLRVFSCKNVTIDNVKIIGGYSNNDAFDIVGSQNVTVQHCFTRTWDDSLVVKAFDEKDKTSPHVVFTGSDTDLTYAFANHMDVEHLRFLDCTLWNDFARPMELGVSLRTDRVHDIEFRNIDVIHSTTGYPLIGAHHGDRADVYDVRFEDIRIEDAPGAQLFDFRITESGWNFDTKKGTLHDFTFRNIQWVETSKFPAEKSRLEGFDKEHSIRNFTFENISFSGKFATTPEEMNLLCLEHVENVRVIAPEEGERIRRVRSILEVPEDLQADVNGKYRVTAKIRLENTTDAQVSGKVWLAVSPVNVVPADEGEEYSLPPRGEIELCRTIELPAGRYILRVQSDEGNLDSDWKLLTLEWELPRDGEQSARYDFVNYYGLRSEGVALRRRAEGLELESPLLKNNALTVFTALPVPVEEKEILFTVEETDFGEAMAAEMKNGRPVIAPQIRCPAEITYVFHNQPKVKEIVQNELPAGQERVVLSWEALGISPDAEEFWLEISAHLPETEGLRYPYTLFHSVWPKVLAHMFCRVRVK